MLPLRHLYLIQNEYSNCRRSVYTLFAETSSKKRIECHISRQPLLVQVSQRLLHRCIPAETSSLRRPPRTRVDDLLHRRRTPFLPLRRHSVAPSTYRGSRNDPSYIPVQSQSDAAPYDNLSEKQLLDLLSSFVMADDTGLLCDAYNTAELGDQDCTKIYIMEKQRFPQWLTEHKTSLKSISDF